MPVQRRLFLAAVSRSLLDGGPVIGIGPRRDEMFLLDAGQMLVGNPPVAGCQCFEAFQHLSAACEIGLQEVRKACVEAFICVADAIEQAECESLIGG